MRPLTRIASAVLIVAAATGFMPQRSRYWTSLTPEDAEILAYLTPYAVEHRNAGLDVDVVIGCDVPVASKPFLAIELVSTQPFGGGGIEDHRYVVVNLNTAEVLDPVQAPAVEIKSAELFGVAAIMRRAHGIDGRVIQKYSSLQPHVTAARPCH
jgi:hypothetical protein